MTEIITLPVARLADLATEINQHHEQCAAAFTSSLEHAMAAGRLLTEAKDGVEHGSWLPWLQANFDGSARTAQGYMRLARELPNAQAPAHMGIEAALDHIAKPTGSQLLARHEAIIHDSLAALRESLTESYHERSHEALGYPSWLTFVDAEFAQKVPGHPEEVAETMRGLLFGIAADVAGIEAPA